jgi:hypothetical protein
VPSKWERVFTNACGPWRGQWDGTGADKQNTIVQHDNLFFEEADGNQYMRQRHQK